MAPRPARRCETPPERIENSPTTHNLAAVANAPIRGAQPTRPFSFLGQWAWQVYLDTYGPAHIVTRRLKADLLIAKQKLGLTEEALEIWQDTLEIFRSESGRTAPETLETTDQFAGFLIENDRNAAATKLIGSAIRDIKAITPPTTESNRWIERLAGRLAEMPDGR